MLSDEDLLDRLQRSAFEYFMHETNPVNGLVADSTRNDAPASIAVVGFALSTYPVAVERGWIAREEAAARIAVTLRFFWNSPQGEQTDATGYKGFYYHFLDLHSGKRAWISELSLMDTALFLAGVLTASFYFTEITRTESENLYGQDVLYAGPLFVHQFSHAWIDFRGIRDRFMREKRCDYFVNSRRATYLQREYAR